MLQVTTTIAFPSRMIAFASSSARRRGECGGGERDREKDERESLHGDALCLNCESAPSRTPLRAVAARAHVFDRGARSGNGTDRRGRPVALVRGRADRAVGGGGRR